MKKSVLASAGLLALALADPAAAADIRPPVYKAPIDPWTWAGGYIGPNMGYSWGQSDTSASFVNSATNAQLFSTNASIPAKDLLGGGQLGANWQYGTWVVGAEADIQGTAERARTAFDCPTGVCTTPARGASANFNQRLTWFGTLRGRVGVTPIEPILVYATGGLAYGRIETLGSVSGFTGAGGTVAAPMNANVIRAGWTIGAGIEGRVNARWTAKLEYLYMDLGNISSVAALPTNSPPLSVTFNSRFTDNILRVGVNYRFENGPIIAKY